MAVMANQLFFNRFRRNRPKLGPGLEQRHRELVGKRTIQTDLDAGIGAIASEFEQLPFGIGQPHRWRVGIDPNLGTHL